VDSEPELEQEDEIKEVDSDSQLLISAYYDESWIGDYSEKEEEENEDVNQCLYTFSDGSDGSPFSVTLLPNEGKARIVKLEFDTVGPYQWTWYGIDAGDHGRWQRNP